MAYHTTMIINGHCRLVYVDEGFRIPGTGEQLRMVDPATGNIVHVSSGSEAWIGDDEMESPSDAIKLEFVNPL